MFVYVLNLYLSNVFMEQFDEKIITCPITSQIFLNPVTTCDGHTYEKDAIKKWFENNDKSPMTNIKLSNKKLIKSILISHFVDGYIKSNPEKKNDQYKRGNDFDFKNEKNEENKGDSYEEYKKKIRKYKKKQKKKIEQLNESLKNEIYIRNLKNIELDRKISNEKRLTEEIKSKNKEIEILMEKFKKDSTHDKEKIKEKNSVLSLLGKIRKEKDIEIKKLKKIIEENNIENLENKNIEIDILNEHLEKVKIELKNMRDLYETLFMTMKN
jgi:hypothetical protein